jgi:hypothetical protein
MSPYDPSSLWEIQCYKMLREGVEAAQRPTSWDPERTEQGPTMKPPSHMLFRPKRTSYGLGKRHVICLHTDHVLHSRGLCYAICFPNKNALPSTHRKVLLYKCLVCHMPLVWKVIWKSSSPTSQIVGVCRTQNLHQGQDRTCVDVLAFCFLRQGLAM